MSLFEGQRVKACEGQSEHACEGSWRSCRGNALARAPRGAAEGVCLRGLLEELQRECACKGSRGAAEGVCLRELLEELQRECAWEGSWRSCRWSVPARVPGGAACDGDLHLSDLTQGKQVVHEARLEGGQEEHEGAWGRDPRAWKADWVAAPPLMVADLDVCATDVLQTSMDC